MTNNKEDLSIILERLDRIEHLLENKEPKSNFYEVKPYDTFSKVIHTIGMDPFTAGSLLTLAITGSFNYNKTFADAHPIPMFLTKIALVAGLNYSAPYLANLFVDLNKNYFTPAYHSASDFFHNHDHANHTQEVLYTDHIGQTTFPADYI